MIRKRNIMKRLLKITPKKEVYKYLVLFYFGGKIQKVLLKQEGKTEAIIKKHSAFGNTLLSTIIKKETKDHKLYDTLEEAKNGLIQFHLEMIKKYKNKIIELNNSIKEIKTLEMKDIKK